MSDKIHPENFCWKCGNPNPSWSAPNELWNEVMERREDIICIKCYQELANEKGINPIVTINK